MTSNIPSSHPLRRWFQGIVEQALYAEVGICQPLLAEYLTDLLTGFLHVDQIYLFRNAQGKRLYEIGEMLARAAESGQLDLDRQRRQVHLHVGDYALFWSGLYPENLRKRHGRNSCGSVSSYVDQGKRAYWIASELSREKDQPPPALLRRLSEDFESCVYGLAVVRRNWQEEDPAGASAIRQVFEG